jgi:hypothetical protein
MAFVCYFACVHCFQALEVIKMLRESGSFKIQRAQMRLRVSVPGENRFLHLVQFSPNRIGLLSRFRRHAINEDIK